MKICTVCNKEIKPDPQGIGTGYGVDKQGNNICYACIGEMDKKELLETGKFIGYLSKSSKDGNYYFSNWPSSFKVYISSISQSNHNFAGRNGRTDFWFKLEGLCFHGVNISKNGSNEIATVRKVKTF